MDKHPDPLLQRFIELDRAARAKRPDAWDPRVTQPASHAAVAAAITAWSRQAVANTGLGALVAREIDTRAGEIVDALAALAGEMESRVLERVAPHVTAAIGVMIRGARGSAPMGLHGAHAFVRRLAHLYEYLCGEESGAWQWTGDRPWED